MLVQMVERRGAPRAKQNGGGKCPTARSYKERYAGFRPALSVFGLEMADSSDVLDAYKREAGEAIALFLDDKLSFPDCMAALEATLAHLIPRLRREHYSAIRALMLENNEIVMKEMERRVNQRRAET